MEDAIMLNNGEECMYLPPGFRFYPTDEEIITYYLSEKVTDSDFTADAIGVVDLNKCELWDLPSKAKMGDKEWYFFCQKDRKYPTGSRTNRATASGYWKATGKDKNIYKGKGKLVGMKKTLVFYRGRAPNGEKTYWVMHEFRLEGSLLSLRCHSKKSPQSQKEEWVVCKIFNKSITHGEGSQNISSNANYIEAPMISRTCHNPNIVSTNFNAMTPLPDLLNLSQEPDGVSLGHMHQQQEPVHDVTQWYHNTSDQLFDDGISISSAMMDTNTLWSL